MLRTCSCGLLSACELTSPATSLIRTEGSKLSPPSNEVCSHASPFATFIRDSAPDARTAITGSRPLVIIRAFDSKITGACAANSATTAPNTMNFKSIDLIPDLLCTLWDESQQQTQMFKQKSGKRRRTLV